MFRFTIRDVLWLMVVVGCAWLLDHRNQDMWYQDLSNSLYVPFARALSFPERRWQ